MEQQQQQQPSGRKQQSLNSNVPLDVMAPLFQCVRCLGAPIKPPIFTCQSGHPTCVECYWSNSKNKAPSSCPLLQGSDDRRTVGCSKCSKPLLSRNEALEDVLRSLPTNVCNALKDCRVQKSKSDQVLHLALQDPMHLVKLERARQEPAEDQASDSVPEDWTEDHPVIVSPSMMEMRASHKPVYCPYPCGRIVTCGSIYAHFDSHHKRVCMRTIHRDRTYCLPAVLPFRNQDRRCFAFFVVRLDDHNDHEKHENQTIVPADMMKMTRSLQDMYQNNILISMLSVGWMPMGEDSRALTVWASCLYEQTPLSYTLSACTENSSTKLSFTGPLVSLHDSQVPQDVFERSESLMIPTSYLQKLADNNGSLILSITYHSEPPSPTTYTHASPSVLTHTS